MKENVRKGEYYVKVDLEDLMGADEELGQLVRSKPMEYMPIVRANPS